MAERDALTEASRALVQQFFALMAADDFYGVSALFAEHVDFRVQGPERHLPWVKPRRTQEEVRRFLDELTGQVETVAFWLDRLVADGPHVVALGGLEDRIKVTGKTYASAFAIHFTVTDGAITQYLMFDDSYAAAAAAMPG